MTSACPDLDVLTKSPSAEQRSHLQTCPSCAALVALRLGEPGDFGDDCRESEALLAVLACGTLNESDEKSLLRHLASCARCMSLAADTLLPAAPKTGDSKPVRWQHAVDSSDDLGQRRGNKRAWILCSLGALAAAAALALIFSPRVQRTLVEREQAAPDRSLAGAARPITTPPAPAKSIEELVADATARVKDQDYSGALALCDSAVLIDPDHQGSAQVCVIAACNLGEAGRARQHLASIRSKTRAAGLRQICLRLGVPLEESAEEVEASGADESAKCQDKPKLSRADITEGIKSIRADVMACGADADGMYKVKMRIGPDGRVTSAETRDDDVGECIATEVKKARFAQSCQSMTFTYPFVFRRADAE